MKVCIDIGGTNLRLAQVNEKLELSNLKVLKTGMPIISLDKIIEHISDLEFDQINISTCGPIDPNTGIYGQLPNLQSWSGFDLKRYLNKHVDCELKIENDANCATLYEAETNTHINSLVYITISTGVGAGAVINNKLFCGDNCLAVSPYKYYINRDTTLDMACSGTGILKSANKFGSYEQTIDVFLDSDNDEVISLLDEWTTNLALYIINTNSFLDVNNFILGGSVIVNNPKYINEISQKVSNIHDGIEIKLTSELQYNALKGAYLIDKY